MKWKHIMKRCGTRGIGTAVTIGLILVAAHVMSIVGQAATGDLVGNVTFSQDCAVGVGITYDGANLWYSCLSSPNLFRADPITGVVSANYTVPISTLGSLAYDAGRNAIWAAGDSGNVYMIQLDASKNVMTTTLAFNTGIPAGLIDGLGFDGTVTPNQLYWSPDVSSTVYVFDVTGTPIRSFPWTGSSSGCGNSGVAIGGNLLFQGSDGCNHVYVVDKNTLAPAFDFPTTVPSDPNHRDESLTCDTNTFAPTDVMWSKEAYSPMRAHAFEVPKGTCGIGGQPAAPKGSISGTKFNDLNGNGTQDAGEPGLANWAITLTNDTGVTITQTTASDGSYNFTNLTDGNYTIGEVIQPGWIQTAPAVSATGSATYRVNISGGNNAVGKDFGNFQLGSVSGMKFEDLNANRVRDPGEAGLAGWQINLTGTDTITGTPVSLTTTTDANGNYNFTGLDSGTYTISETMQNGWAQTTPAAGTYTVTITSGAAITGQDFGNFHEGKITGGGWISITGDPKATFGLVGQYPDSSNTANGSVEYQDHNASLNIKSIQINTVATTLDKKKGAITGLATVNGAGSYPFVVYVEDNAEPGKGADVFMISLPTYPYSNGAVLSGGNIQIHS